VLLFQRHLWTLEAQKQFCKTLFSGNGQLYEPPNLAALTKVHNFGSATFSRSYWFMGIQDPYQNGALSYTSDELPIPFTIPEVSIAPYNPDGCVLIYPEIAWRGFCCSCNVQYAICEIAQN